MFDFVKYHTLGNDYLVIDPNRRNFSPRPELIRLLCDRHHGIGADGVLLGPIRPVVPSTGRVTVRIFDRDGGECASSGNGIRIFALYVATYYKIGDRFSVSTTAGDSPVHIVDLENGVVCAGMGRPKFDARDIPFTGVDGPVILRALDLFDQNLTVTCVNLGNPHAVVPMNDFPGQTTEDLGRCVSTHPAFPHGCNVEFLRVIDQSTIEIRSYERGAGYTLASGTGSCAAAHAAHAMGLVYERVRVRMPGGELTVNIAPDGWTTVTGPAHEIAIGMLSKELDARLRTSDYAIARG